jgi:predicted Zn-dependent protease
MILGRFKPSTRAGAVNIALSLVFMLCAGLTTARAQALSFTNFVAQGEAAAQRKDVAGAFKYYTAADHLQSTNCAELCVLTRRYCDLMYDAESADLKKTLAERALATARRAVQSDPKSATAHLCVAVCYAKNFPYVDNQTKVNWSRSIKSECETALKLDPKQDLGYYLLGRWNYDVANVNFIYRALVKFVYGGLPNASVAEAIHDFKQASALAPNRILHHYQLGKVYADMGENKLAIAELTTCSRLKPIDRDDADAQHDASMQLKELQGNK